MAYGWTMHDKRFVEDKFYKSETYNKRDNRSSPARSASLPVE